MLINQLTKLPTNKYMIYLLHGDDITASKNRLVGLTLGFKNVVTLNAEKASISDLVQAFSSTDMFVITRCIVIEKVLKLPKKETEKLIDLLEHLDSSTTVILWHNTELSKVALSKFKKANVEVFLLPKLFFTFLDNLNPQNVKMTIDTLHKMQNMEAEQIFYAMVKRVRQLMMVKVNSNSEEMMKMSPWQRDKLKVQGSKWQVKELEHLYNMLFKLEVDMKSGGLMLPLRNQLDIVLLSGLN